MNELDATTQSLLQSFGFDLERFGVHQARARDSQGVESNAIQDTLRAPAPGDIHLPPRLGSEEHAHCTSVGIEALRNGEVASVVLAGGMATRFGGVVKATVEVHNGASFLELKLRDARRASVRSGGRIPVYFMTSFATHKEVSEAIRSVSDDHIQARAFPQFISLRLNEDGEIFRDESGAVSPYAPGHGDLPFALRNSGLLDEFRSSGGKLFCMSNVDNLTASLDPTLIGWHLTRGVDMSVEVTAKHPGDKGGAPAWVAESLEIVEGFRFPSEFDQDSIPVFNTNTLMFDAEAIAANIALDFFAVRKQVHGNTVIQFERLVGQLTAHLSSAYLQVPREGIDGRFHPVKDPAELQRRLPQILSALKDRGIV